QPHGYNRLMWVNANGDSKNMSSPNGPEGGLWEFGPGWYALLANTNKKARAQLRNATLLQHYKRRDNVDVTRGSILDNSLHPADGNTYIHPAASNTSAG